MTDLSAACEAIGHDWRTSEASGQVECQRCGLSVQPTQAYEEFLID